MLGFTLETTFNMIVNEIRSRMGCMHHECVGCCRPAGVLITCLNYIKKKDEMQERRASPVDLHGIKSKYQKLNPADQVAA